MDPSFSLEGIELGKLVLNSGLLQSSWSKISEVNAANNPSQDSALATKKFSEAKFTIVVFTAPPISRNSSAPTLLPGSHDPNPLQFLRSEKVSSFSVHTPAFEIFASANKDLSNLKTELLKLLESKPVIITGAGLGGSVASLFTLWLLETINPKLKRPLCITFGSPLIGDASLQKILENSVRSSCFLHVVNRRRFFAQPPITDGFTPIGMFLICFDSKCICIQDPEAVMDLLIDGSNIDLIDYDEVLRRLDQSVLSMADSKLMIADVINGMKTRVEEKNPPFDSFEKLNRMKVIMMTIEWYKKDSKKDKTGYYDHFRSEIETAFKTDVQRMSKELNLYWKGEVEEVEKNPQSDIAILKRRFLFSGNNYRRLVEPLDIAEYYREGKTEYSVRERSSHYVMLEKWLKDAKLEPERSTSSDLSHLLTFDSCFWAEVEEAIIVINQLNAVAGMRDEALIGKLEKFEEYVWGMIEKREVSPEIFLEQSSFIRWWKEYKEIKERNGFNSSPFTEYMENKTYKSYGSIAA